MGKSKKTAVSVLAIDAASLENAIAISADFHTHPRYQNFYDLNADKLSGFTGIYSVIADMARALTRWEQKGDRYESGGFDWVEVCERFVSAVLDQGCASGYLNIDAALRKAVDRTCDCGVGKGKGLHSMLCASR